MTTTTPGVPPKWTNQSTTVSAGSTKTEISTSPSTSITPTSPTPQQANSDLDSHHSDDPSPSQHIQQSTVLPHQCLYIPGHSQQVKQSNHSPHSLHSLLSRQFHPVQHVARYRDQLLDRELRLDRLLDLHLVV